MNDFLTPRLLSNLITKFFTRLAQINPDLVSEGQPGSSGNVLWSANQEGGSITLLSMVGDITFNYTGSPMDPLEITCSHPEFHDLRDANNLADFNLITARMFAELERLVQVRVPRD